MTMKTVDLAAIRDKLEMEVDWSFVESEGPDTVRFDQGHRSLWVYRTGAVDGLADFPALRQRDLRKWLTALGCF